MKMLMSLLFASSVTVVSKVTDSKRVNRAVALNLFLALACLALACSSKPTEANGREVFENKAKEGSFSLVSFKKTNGAEAGGDRYTLDFEAALECGAPAKTGTPIFVFVHDKCVFQCLEKGQKFTLKGAMTFQKSETGWKVANCDWQR